MTDLVIRTVNGATTFMKDHDPFKPHEKPLSTVVLRIGLTDLEAQLGIDVLAMLYEFKMLEQL